MGLMRIVFTAGVGENDTSLASWPLKTWSTLEYIWMKKRMRRGGKGIYEINTAGLTR